MKKYAIILLFLCLHYHAHSTSRFCSHEAAVKSFRRPSYEFSINLLDKVAEVTDSHFVFLPLSTWIQLTTLAEGARGRTLSEISATTKFNRLLCNRRLLKEILNNIYKIPNGEAMRNSYMIINNVFNVKNKFKTEAQRADAIKILPLNFEDADGSAAVVNNVISTNTNGLIKNVIDSDDFDGTSLLMADVAYFKSFWKIPFKTTNTKRTTFYSEENLPIGEVNMMSQFGIFNMTTIKQINAQVLELECDEQGKLVMLFFLPINGKSIGSLYQSLKKISIRAIYSEFNKNYKHVANIKLPRFKIVTEVDNLPELIYDMGIKKIFYPDTATLKGISDYNLYASLMTQVTSIEVTEEGVRANNAEFVIFDYVDYEFVANRPFGFMLLNKESEIILYAGIYSKPSLF